jgi:uncharacterized protein (DUF2141 family)
MAPRTCIVEGTIQFENVRFPAQDVTVYIRVEEVSRLDAPGSRVAEVVLHGVHVFAGAPPISLTARATCSPSGRYVVRVHADVDGDGKVSRGDYASVQSYPVLASAEADSVAIVVREVR